MKTQFYSLLATLMLCFFSAGCVNDKEPDGASLGIGDTLPQFSVALNTGETVSTASLKGKTAAIVFFNTGCSDCRAELPVIQQLYDFYVEDPYVEIVLISREESQESVENYWNEEGFTMPYSAQTSREVYSLFAKSVIPRIYIANRNSEITAMYDDVDMPSFQTLQNDIMAAKFDEILPMPL